jgi:DNA processing protein
MRTDAVTVDWLRLTLTPGVGATTLQRALRAFGMPGAVLGASHGELASAIGPRAAEALLKGAPPEAVEAAARWLAADDHALVTLSDAAYPPRLLATADPPAVLYAIGRIDLLHAPSIAIVGSRSATPQGLRDAARFAEALGQAGLTIVSGLAAGIDAAAHRGGLASAASTIAVLGTGPDRVYPAAHRALAHQIAEAGLILTEFPLGTPPLRENFPRRNRIISGIALGCLVIEAALESGSLITAREAADQGREVFAVPGSIHSPVARGCHALIRQGAKLVECADDVLEELSPRPLGRTAPDAASGSRRNDDHPLLAAMGNDPIDIDSLCVRAGLTPDVVSAMLMSLELEGRVGALPGGRFQQLAR